MHSAIMLRALFSVAVRVRSFPDDLVNELVLAENLVEHDFDVVAGVPVAVVVKASGFFQHAMQLHTTWAHELHVSLRGCMSIFEGAFLFRLAPEHFVVPVRIERRVDVDQIDACVGELF